MLCFAVIAARKLMTVLLFVKTAVQRLQILTKGRYAEGTKLNTHTH